MTRKDELWGLNLHTTGLIIGWMCLIINVIQCLYILYYMYDIPRMAAQVAAEGNVKGDRREAEETVKAVATVTLCIYLLFVMVDLFTTILLIIGINTDSSILLLPWLILNIITITARVCCSICMFIFCALSAASANETIIFIAFHGITTVITIWMWIFILELYLYID